MEMKIYIALEPARARYQREPLTLPASWLYESSVPLVPALEHAFDVESFARQSGSFKHLGPMASNL